MLRIFCVSDLHNDVAAARRAALDARRQASDVVVSAGDLALDGEHDPALYRALRTTELPMLCVPGNHDGDEPYRASVAREGLTDIDGRLVERGGVLFAGWGIRCNDEALSGPERRHQQEDSVLAFVLSQIERALPARVVLVTHLPPWGVRAASDRDGIDRGNAQLRSWLERVQPPMVVCGHVHHDRAVVSHVGKTEVVNPGPHGYLVTVP